MSEYVTIRGNLEHYALVTPDAPIASQGTRTITYQEALTYVDEIGRAMVAAGFKHGDRFAVYGNPHLDVLMLFLAGSSIGSIFVGLNPKQTEAELRRVLNAAEPAALFVVGEFESEHIEKVRRAAGSVKLTVIGWNVSNESGLATFADFSGRATLSESNYAAARSTIGPMDPVAMVFTSGSTGQPKGTMLTSAPMVRSYRVQAKHWYDPANPPHGLADLPIHHLGFIGDNCMAVIAAGGSVSILDRWTPEAALAMIESDRIDFWWTQTTMLLLATQSDAWHTTDLSSVRTIGFAGAPVQDCMLRSLEAVGAQLVTGYGMTEVHGNVTYTDADADHEELLETVGRPDEEFRVLVVDDEGSEVAPGEVGEIVIDAPTMVVGYWYGPGDVRSVRERDGWYHTNDLARRRADGNLELVGRKDHMYKSGGFNVFPREVELAIEEHPDVAAAVVIGVPDARWGHVGTAFIRRATKNLTEDEIREHAQSRLANYKVPKRIVVCDDFPMLASGKVDRVALGKL